MKRTSKKKNKSIRFIIYEWSKWTCDYVIEIVGIVIFRNIETKLITYSN